MEKNNTQLDLNKEKLNNGKEQAISKESVALSLYEAMESALMQMSTEEWKSAIMRIISTISSTPEPNIPSVDVYNMTLIYDMFERIGKEGIDSRRRELLIYSCAK